jgi:hypothetical protein
VDLCLSSKFKRTNDTDSQTAEDCPKAAEVAASSIGVQCVQLRIIERGFVSMKLSSVDPLARHVIEFMADKLGYLLFDILIDLIPSGHFLVANLAAT